MRNKSVFLLLACVCGTIAAIGVSQWMQAQNTGQATVQMQEIFVTTKTIDVAEEITAEKIRLEEWPADRIPEGSASNLEEIEGKYARQRFYAGEPVMPIKLMNDTNGTSQTIPKGFSVVSMKADPENAVASLVRPGDRVDVMAYFTKSEMIPETMAKTVLRGIRVFAVDGRTQRDEDDDDGKAARTISLLIQAADAEAWTYASELGKIRLTLGNPGAYETDEEAEGHNAAEQFLAWLADHQRAQTERMLAKAEPAPEPTHEPADKKKKSGFKMLKMSNGKMTEYEWVEDQLVPVVTSKSGSEPDPNDADLAPKPVETASSDDGDYSYLNGADSPFFQPPSRGPSPSNERQGVETDRGDDASASWPEAP